MARPSLIRDPEVVALVNGWLEAGRAPGRILAGLATLSPPVEVSSETLRRYTQRWRQARVEAERVADHAAQLAAGGVVEDLVVVVSSCGRCGVSPLPEVHRCGAGWTFAAGGDGRVECPSCLRRVAPDVCASHVGAVVDGRLLPMGFGAEYDDDEVGSVSPWSGWRW